MRSALTAAIALALLPPAAAEDAPEPALRLPEVAVVASKVEQEVTEVAGTVSVIDRERLDELLVRDIADIVRYEPGVAVPEDASRFGLQGFSVRGLDGNRVGIEVDGIPVADGFAVGSFSRAGRDVIDPAVLQRVEILRGPASTLYGSDALGGVVSFRTRAPRDVLVAEGRYLGARAGWAGRNDSLFLSGTGAAAGEAWEALATVAGREGHETGNTPRAGGLHANPADFEDRFGIAKLGYRNDVAGDFVLTLEHAEGERDTDVRSLVRGPGQYATTTSLLADDRHERTRASLHYERMSDWFGEGHLELNLFAQDTGFDQRTDQVRGGSRPTQRLRRFEFDTRLRGGELLVEGITQAGAFEHWQIAGIEYVRSDLTELRDGVEIDLTTGARSNVIIGEVLPVRDFPDSVTEEVGLYWQDEIRWGTRWSLIPGLRYERYSVDARPDALWRADNPDALVVDLDEDRLTPKLGLRYAVSDRTSLFAQYAAGFRAPPFADVNIGLNIAAFGYRAIPNPDLESETSHGFELGLRHFAPGRRIEVATFHNRYRNLIESRVNLGRDPESGLLIFQSQNRDRARIHGVEASWQEDLEPWLGTPGWSALAALSWTRGTDTVRDEPLNSVLPPKLVAGLRWDSGDRRHGVELLATFVAGKDEVDRSGAALFEPPGYAVFDLFYRFRPADAVRVDVGLFNLADRRYWEWTRVRGVEPDAHDLDLYTSPGRNAAVTLSLDW